MRPLNDIVHGLQALPSRNEQMLSRDKRIEATAEDFSDKHHALFWGVAINIRLRSKAR